MKVLVLNCGSSSIKYQLLDMTTERPLAKGLLERVGTENARLTHEVNEHTTVRLRRAVPNHETGLDWVVETLLHPERGPLRSLEEIDAVGHRVVHAGERYTGSVLVTEDVIDALRECSDLAPLHNPPNLAGIEACRRLMPGKPMVCVFDNAIHHTLPPRAYLYALPRELCKKYGIRRYGFHGIAFRSALEQTVALLGKPLEEMRVLTLMLGSGCTANAMKYGQSVDVSTGFTPLEGLVQSTRTGDLDAAAVLYLMEKEGLGPKEMTDLLNRRSGLLGLSEVSNDLRDIEKAAAGGNEWAQQALEVFAYRCRKYIGAYAAAMGGLEVLVFAGGIGQNAAEMRARICEDLEFLGLRLDPERNAACVGESGFISAPDSPVPILVVVVNEELVIARDTVAVLRLESGTSGPSK